MKEIRRENLRKLLASSRFNGDREKFRLDAGITKGRLSQLLDNSQPFGDAAERNLVEKLGLEAGYFSKRNYELKGEPGHNDLPKQIDTPASVAGEASATAMEIALLYDLIPVSDRIRRTKAYNSATSAILAVLEEQPPTSLDAPGAEK